MSERESRNVACHHPACPAHPFYRGAWTMVNHAQTVSPYYRELANTAKKVSAEYEMHRLADPLGNIGRWFAARFSDGSSDHVLYDSKADAVRHQHHDEQFYAFIQIVPANMSERDALVHIVTQRRMHDSGIRLADRDHRNGGRDMIRRLNTEDQRNQLRSLFRGDVAPTNIIIPEMGIF